MIISVEVVNTKIQGKTLWGVCIGWPNGGPFGRSSNWLQSFSTKPEAEKFAKSLRLKYVGK